MAHGQPLQGRHPHRALDRQKSGPSEVNLVVKYILFALNVLFWLFGLIMVIIGVYAKTEKGFGEIGKTLPWFMDPANIFMIIGAIIFILAFLGCIGSLRENIILLRIFEIVIDILLIAEIALAIYIYVDRKRVKKNVENVLVKTIPKYRDDPDLQSIIDWVQLNVKCCGIKSDADWDENIYFNCSSGLPSPEKCGVPYSCCINYEKERNRQCGYEMRNKEKSDSRGMKIYVSGCVDRVIDKLVSEDNLILIVCIGGAVVLLQLVTTGLAHSLVYGIQRQIAKRPPIRMHDGRVTTSA